MSQMLHLQRRSSTAGCADMASYSNKRGNPTCISRMLVPLTFVCAMLAIVTDANGQQKTQRSSIDQAELIAIAFVQDADADEVVQEEDAVADEPKAETATAESNKKDEDAGTQDDTEDVGDEVPAATAPEKKLPPRTIRFHLLDGTVVTGQLSVDSITVSTDFGKLSIPVDKIKAFRPGLTSYETMKQKIDELVENLGADDYNTRQESHRELSALGMKIKNIIGEYKDGGNAERKRHLEEVRKEIEEMAEEMEEEGESKYDERPWIDGDEVVTQTFTVVGKIEESEFAMDSKYGNLNVALNDVSFGDRPSESKPEIRRSLKVSGSQIAQSSFKSTLIRVQSGDVVTIRAEGHITMSPWGSDEMSTPDGGTNYGWYQSGEIEAGALVGKIGNSGKVFKVGSKKRFVCRTSGTLNLAIGMNPDYATGYNYPGEYSVKITVQPK